MRRTRGKPPSRPSILSGNTKDFGKDAVKALFRGAGVGKFFTEARSFLDWIHSQSSPD